MPTVKTPSGGSGFIPIALVDRDASLTGNDIAETFTNYPNQNSGEVKISEFYRGGDYVSNVSQNLNVPTSGEIKFSDFYNATHSDISISSAANIGSIDPNYSLSHNNLQQIYFTTEFYLDTANNRVKARTYTNDINPSSSFTHYTTNDFITYSGFTSNPTVQMKWVTNTSSINFNTHQGVSTEISGGAAQLGGETRLPNDSAWSYNDRIAGNSYTSLGAYWKKIQFYTYLGAPSGYYSSGTVRVGNLTRYLNFSFKFTGGGLSGEIVRTYSTASNSSSSKLRLLCSR